MITIRPRKSALPVNFFLRDKITGVFVGCDNPSKDPDIEANWFAGYSDTSEEEIRESFEYLRDEDPSMGDDEDYEVIGIYEVDDIADRRS